jgi:hypothetical protein
MRRLMLTVAFLLAVSAVILILRDPERAPVIRVILVAEDTYRVEADKEFRTWAADRDMGGDEMIKCLADALRAGRKKLRADDSMPPDADVLVDMRSINFDACTAHDLVRPFNACWLRGVKRMRIEGADISLMGRMETESFISMALPHREICTVRREEDLPGFRNALDRVPAARTVVVTLGEQAKYGVTLRAMGVLVKSGRPFCFQRRFPSNDAVVFSLRSDPPKPSIVEDDAGE